MVRWGGCIECFGVYQDWFQFSVRWGCDKVKLVWIRWCGLDSGQGFGEQDLFIGIDLLVVFDYGVMCDLKVVFGSIKLQCVLMCVGGNQVDCIVIGFCCDGFCMGQ